jgi:glycerol kinase
LSSYPAVFLCHSASMKQSGILAVDAGTTSVTGLVLRMDGTVAASHSQEFTQHFPADGWVEHDLGEVWAATLDACRQAIDQADLTIVAVGITNQRETACFWDRETLGSPRRAIVWQDRRTAEICAELREQGHEEFIRRTTGLRLDPYFTATKLQWVRENDPHTWAHVQSGRVAIGTIDSYLIARMSRGLDHITDHSNASRTLLYDITSGAWSEQLCELFDVPLDALPQIVPSYGELSRTDPGAFLGLDVPIAGIAGDQQAALVGQGGVVAGELKCTYGTGSFLLLHTGHTASTSRSGLLTTVGLGYPDGSRTFALEGSVFVTGSAVQWLRDGLGIIASWVDVEPLARSVDDSGGVVFVPALTGLGAPVWDPYARGLIIGITRATNTGHIARATLEAIAFEVADIVDVMREESGMTVRSLRVDGGAAANDLLCQIQADALGVEIDRSAELQTTGLGAAFLAGAGIGAWDLPTLSATRRSDRVFEPKAPVLDRGPWHEAVTRSQGWADGAVPS